MGNKIIVVEKDDNKIPRLEWIDAELLCADAYFQNTFDPKRVELMVDTYAPELMQPLDISFRDGKYNVVDGKHRLSMLITIQLKTGSKIKVPCSVRYGMTEEEEYDLFVKLAKNRRKISAMEIYKASYKAGNDFTKEFVDTIRKVGFIFDFVSTSKNGRIHMTATPHEIFKELKVKEFEKFMSLFYRTWNGNKKFIKADFMSGLYEFYKIYRKDIDEDIFIKRLSLMTDYDSDGFFSDKTRNIAVLIFRKYNKNKRLYQNNILKEKLYFTM